MIWCYISASKWNCKGLQNLTSAKSRRVDDGMRLFRKTSVRGVIANTVTYSSLIQGFCQSGKINDAKELFQEEAFLVPFFAARTYDWEREQVAGKDTESALQKPSWQWVDIWNALYLRACKSSS